MPLPQNTTLGQFYQNIADITGIDFKSGSLEDVNSALSQIYIDGTNIFSKLGINEIDSLDAGNIKQISHTLDQAMSATDETYNFVSIMSPDDPTATPRMISNKTLKDDRGRAIENPDKVAKAKELQQKKNAAAKSYESNFKKTHKQKLAELNQSLDKLVPSPGEFRIGTNLFSKSFLNPTKGLTLKPTVLRDLKNNVGPAVDMCNLVLINRGYTMEELAGDGINAREGRNEVGSRIEALLTNMDMDAKEREMGLKSFMEEAFSGLDKLQFKPVDLSNDSTLSNVNDNRLIATMADSMKKMVQYAQKDLKYGWLPEAAENAANITNYTDGVMNMDIQRIKASQSATRNEESVTLGVTAQAYIDSIGPNYLKYRTTDIGSAKNELSMTNALDAALTETLSEQEQMKEKQALDQAVRKNRPQEYRDIVKERIKNSEALTAAREHAAITADNSTIIKPTATVIRWGNPEEGKTFKDYRDALVKSFPGNAQLDRETTISTMFLMHAVWEAENAGEAFDLKSYMADPKRQSAAAAKAFDFYQKHPIPAATDEQTKINVELFGQITDSFYRNIHEMEIPHIDCTDPVWQAEEAEALTKFTKDFKTIIQDSEQLRDLVPKNNKELSGIFFDQMGGEKAYNDIKCKNGLAGLTIQAENDILKVYDDLETKSLDYIFANGDGAYNMRKLAVATYFLNNSVEPIIGRKIKDLPANEGLSALVQGFYQNGVTSGPFGKLYRVSGDPAKTRENKRKLLEYVMTGGEKDELGVKEAFDQCEALKRAENEVLYNEIPTMSDAIKAADSNHMTEEERRSKEELRKQKREETARKDKEAEIKAAAAAKEAEEKRKLEEQAKKAAEEARAAEEKAEAERKAEEAKKAAEAAKRAEEEKARQLRQAKEEKAKQAQTRELTEIEFNKPHDWSAELPEADWKARLKMMEQKLAEKDPALLKSSAEYKAAREGLKAALKALDAPGGMDQKAFNESMDKVFHNAGNYIAKKEEGKVGKYYGQERLDAMRDIRGMLANRNSCAMDPSGIAELFGVGDTYAEKLETGFLRLGAYLNEAELKKLDNPKESKEMIDLVERVLAERGKDKYTRNELKEQMALQDGALFSEDAKQLDHANQLRQAKDAVMKVMRSKTSMTETAANWFGVMNAYETMAAMHPSDKVKRSGSLKNVKEVAMCGRLAQKVMETRYKAMDFDAPEQLTKQEATEMVAFASLGEFMRHPNSLDHIKVFNAFMNSNDSESKLLKNFAEQNTVKKLCEKRGKDAINHISSRTAQQSLGKLGMVELTEKLRQDSLQMQERMVKSMNKTLAISPDKLKEMKAKQAAKSTNPQQQAKQAGKIEPKRNISTGIQKKIDALNKAAQKSSGRGLK